MNFEYMDKTSAHTISKFKLISSYTYEWAEKLMNYKNCEGIIFIDCMCNCGEYIDKSTGEIIKGTGLRVIDNLIKVAYQQKYKIIEVYFNDICEEKVKHLKKRIESNKLPKNLIVHYSVMDASEFLLGFNRNKLKNKNTLLIYDPYKAKIDWEALNPFVNIWGEVIINHMVSDVIRGKSQAKKEEVKERYSKTYKMDFDKLLQVDNKEDYEKIIEENIISCIRKKSDPYISAIPFYISTNVLMYNLIHLSFNKKGFILFKKNAWKVANGHSAIKAKNMEDGMQLSFDIGESVQGKNFNYDLNDVAYYIKRKYEGRKEVFLNEVYEDLDNHPIFPSEGYKNEIKGLLKIKGCKLDRKKIYF